MATVTEGARAQQTSEEEVEPDAVGHREEAQELAEDLPPAAPTGSETESEQTPASDAKEVQPKRAPRKLEVLPGSMARGIGRVPGRAVWVGSPDRRFIFRFSGFSHLDFRYPLEFTPDGVTGEAFPMARRARFAAEGTTFGTLDYRVMFDVAVELAPLDAYLDWRPLPAFNLRLGKFKSPFGFERRARAFSLVFNERAFPTLLAPNRDVGGFIHGQSVEGFFSYDLALLSGAGNVESVSRLRGTPEFAGRVYFQPFRLTPSLDVLKHFGVGFSATWGNEDGTEEDPRLGSLQTTGRNVFFEYRQPVEDPDAPGVFSDGAFSNGERKRWSVHGHYRHGRLNTMWEYVWASQTLQIGDQTSAVPQQAWQGYIGAALTDDEWGFFGIEPKRPFDPQRGQWGAVSVAARYHSVFTNQAKHPLFADPDTAVRSAHAVSTSLHWFHTVNLQFYVDAEVVTFQGGAPLDANRPTELNFTTRVQAFF